LFGQIWELLISGERFLNRGNLILRDVASQVGPVLPTLEIVIRPGGALPKDPELSPFHGLNLRDLFEERLRRDLSIQAGIVCI
jgi:hypothetical protein